MLQIAIAIGDLQATSTREHLLEAAAQKQLGVQKQVQAYTSIGEGVQQVGDGTSLFVLASLNSSDPSTFSYLAAHYCATTLIIQHL